MSMTTPTTHNRLRKVAEFRVVRAADGRYALQKTGRLVDPDQFLDAEILRGTDTIHAVLDAIRELNKRGMTKLMPEKFLHLLNGGAESIVRSLRAECN